MSIFVVTRKDTGAEVYRYAYSGPALDLPEYPLATHTHSEWVEDAPPPVAPARITKLRVFQRDADASGYRDLAANKVRTFVTGLEGGVLAAGRATVILDTPVSKREAWQP
jgi:hypothetical protein